MTSDAEAVAKLAMEARRSSRPVLFETGDEDYPYQNSGSSGLLRRRGHLFVVSAGHLITNLSGGPPHPDRLRVPYSVAAPLNPQRAFVSHNAMLSLSPVSADDLPDWADLLVAPLDPALTDESLFGAELPFHLDHLPPLNTLGTVLIRGYPTEFRNLDPDARKMTYEPLDLIGQSTQPFGAIEGMLQVDLTTDHRLSTLDGMSGAPAFRVAPSGISFAGVLVRGGGKHAHIIRADVVVATLDAYLAGRGQATALLRPIM
jgi:hypothetical protein